MQTSTGLFGPESVMWRINRERLVLLAGPAAAILQVAHPIVARGVAAHSRFRTDSTGRLARTLEAVYTVAFGTAEEVEIVRTTVWRMHRAVKGEGYDAFDPQAQLWVLATLIMGSVTMYERFVGPLTDVERDDFLQENKRFGFVFGLEPDVVWNDWPEFSRYWEETIQGSDIGSTLLCGEVARGVICPDKPWYMRMLSPVFRALALEMIPSDLSGRLGLGISRISRPLWMVLDHTLPCLLHLLPERIRFAPHYLQAKRRGVEAAST